MRNKDLRQSSRKPLHYRAWISLGDDSKQHNCMLSDVSETGAKVTLATAVELPKNFFLLLSLSGNSRRYCELVWRKGLSLGIKFLTKDLRHEIAEKKSEVVAL